MEEWRHLKEWDKMVSSAYGLAVDEMLMHSINENNSPPTLHLYRFKPAAIVGKYQDIRAALKIDRCRELGIEYNRRNTGGGTVIMGEKTVALGLGISLKHPKMRRGIEGIFKVLSGVLIDALTELGIKAGFRPKNDIEVAGKKIAGMSASAEIGDTLLFHSSILVDFDIAQMLEIMNLPTEKLSDKGYSCFSERMTTIEKELGQKIEMAQVMEIIVRSFEEEFGASLIEDQMNSWEKNEVEELIVGRYGNEEWIFSHRHPRSRMATAFKKTPGGLLQVYLSLSGSAIENVIVTGDYFSTTQDVNRIESALKWTTAEKKDIENNLKEVWRKDIIYGVDIPSLTEAILKAKDNYLNQLNPNDQIPI
jgi:lipoate-protein ligase A